MFVLRGTSRLLKRLNVEMTSDTPVSTTRLGDWYGNLIHVGRRQFVLAISEKTFLPVLVPAAPSAGLASRIRVAVGDILRVLGVSRGEIETEDAAMNEAAYGKTINKQALGILVDFAKALPYYIPKSGSLLDASLKLAATPCSPLFETTVSPDRATIASFGAGHRNGARPKSLSNE